MSALEGNFFIFLFSPASPPAMDLRTIMEIEENMQKCGTMPKTNSRLVKKTKQQHNKSPTKSIKEECGRSGCYEFTQWLWHFILEKEQEKRCHVSS